MFQKPNSAQGTGNKQQRVSVTATELNMRRSVVTADRRLGSADTRKQRIVQSSSFSESIIDGGRLASSDNY